MKHKLIAITPGLSVGGAERFLISLVNSLDNKKEFDILLISLSKENYLATELNKNIKFISLTRSHKFDIEPLKKLRKLIIDNKPKTIFCINFFSFFYFVCSTLYLKTNYKRIISYHSTTFKTKKEFIKNRFFSLFIKKDDIIITVSDKQREITSSYFKIPKDNFITIHNGVNTKIWTPVENTTKRYLLRKSLEIPEDAKVIVITAAFRSEKNHISALKAFDVLLNVYGTNAYLLLVGDGYMKEEIIKYIKLLNLNNYVKLVGLQDDVKPFYNLSDLFSLTSNSIETFSIAALEAMSCGIPCVLTRIGGASEMIVEGFNGYTCSTKEDDIARSWHLALNSKFDSKKIREFVIKNFDHKEMTESYLKAIR